MKMFRVTKIVGVEPFSELLHAFVSKLGYQVRSH